MRFQSLSSEEWTILDLYSYFHKFYDFYIFEKYWTKHFVLRHRVVKNCFKSVKAFFVSNNFWSSYLESKLNNWQFIVSKCIAAINTSKCKYLNCLQNSVLFQSSIEILKDSKFVALIKRINHRKSEAKF